MVIDDSLIICGIDNSPNDTGVSNYTRNTHTKAIITQVVHGEYIV